MEAALRIVQSHPIPYRLNNMSQQLQNTIETAWENRANPVSRPLPPREVVDAVEQVIAELNERHAARGYP